MRVCARGVKARANSLAKLVEVLFVGSNLVFRSCCVFAATRLFLTRARACGALIPRARHVPVQTTQRMWQAVFHMWSIRKTPCVVHRCASQIRGQAGSERNSGRAFSECGVP